MLDPKSLIQSVNLTMLTFIYFSMSCKIPAPVHLLNVLLQAHLQYSLQTYPLVLENRKHILIRLFFKKSLCYTWFYQLCAISFPVHNWHIHLAWDIKILENKWCSWGCQLFNSIKYDISVMIGCCTSAYVYMYDVISPWLMGLMHNVSKQAGWGHLQ